MTEKINPADYLAIRNDLFDSLKEIDAEINKALAFNKSKRAAETARNLFADRARVVDELLVAYGIQAQPHSSLSGEN